MYRMYQCKHAKKAALQMKTINKLILSLAAVALICSVSISGVLAWLTGQTGVLVNTFTYGDVQLVLTEDYTIPDDNPDDDVIPNEYIMLPGKAITKNPVVTVAGGSEFCWLFVHLEKSEKFDSYLTYDIADGWIALPEYDGVYYRELADEASMEEAAGGLHVIQEDMVYVQENVTRTDLQMLHEQGNEFYPTLTVTAYAVQKEGFDEPEEAWLLVQEQMELEQAQEEPEEE
ncbi:MAG: hypothetical protein IJA90_10535 [Peptococcaceae bacterium]|nr:hypothetical protein [Peptococcaceae bacterium]